MGTGRRRGNRERNKEKKKPPQTKPGRGAGKDHQASLGREGTGRPSARPPRAASVSTTGIWHNTSVQIYKGGWKSETRSSCDAQQVNGEMRGGPGAMKRRLGGQSQTVRTTRRVSRGLSAKRVSRRLIRGVRGLLITRN